MTNFYKTLIYILLCMCFANPSIAGSDEDEALEAFAKTTIETMVKEFLKEQLNDYVVEQIGSSALDAYLVEEFGEKAGTGVVNQIFATYSLYNSAVMFDNAESQSSKYYATVGMVGAAVSFVYPPVGALIQLANMGSQLVSAAATKGRVEDLIEMQEEIIKIYTNIVKIKAIIINTELQTLNFYYTSYFTYLKKTFNIENLMEKKCSFIPANDEKLTIKCFEYAIKKHNYLKIAVAYLDLSLKFSSQYVDLNEFFKINESKLTQEKLLENIVDLKLQLGLVDKSLDQMYENLTVKLYDIAKHNANSEAKLKKLKNKCLTEANTILFYANITEYNLLTAQVGVEQINMLVSYRAEQITKLVNTAKQCLAISDLSTTEKSSLQSKLKYAHKLQEKDISVFFQANLNKGN